MSTSFTVQTREGDFRSVGFLSRDNWFPFKPQSELPRLKDIQAKVPRGQKWIDDFEYEHPKFPQPPVALQPEEVPSWENTEICLAKTGANEGSRFDPSDVCQGQVGNCWIMSAISAVCNMGLISGVFSDVDEERGIYEVRLWRLRDEDADGIQSTVSSADLEPIYVCVDRRVHVLPGRRTPVYCYSDDPGELWPTIVEKAFAKAIVARESTSGFRAMEGGLFCVGVLHLLGRFGRIFLPPGKDEKGFNPDSFADELRERVSRGHAVGCSFASDDSAKVVGPSGEKGAPMGLVAGHAYTVLDVQDVELENEEVITLVRLRNPWGKRGAGDPNLEWGGDWSDASPLWAANPGAAAACGMNRKPDPDGCFWLDVRDLCKHMNAYEVGAAKGVELSHADWRDLTHAPCGRCAQPAVGRKLKALDRSWHAECFVCSVCGKGLDGAFAIIQDRASNGAGGDLPAHAECAQQYQNSSPPATLNWKPSSLAPPPPPPPRFRPGALQRANLILKDTLFKPPAFLKNLVSGYSTSASAAAARPAVADPSDPLAPFKARTASAQLAVEQAQAAVARAEKELETARNLLRDRKAEERRAGGDPAPDPPGRSAPRSSSSNVTPAIITPPPPPPPRDADERSPADAGGVFGMLKNMFVDDDGGTRAAATASAPRFERDAGATRSAATASAPRSYAVAGVDGGDVRGVSTAAAPSAVRRGKGVRVPRVATLGARPATAGKTSAATRRPATANPTGDHERAGTRSKSRARRANQQPTGRALDFEAERDRDESAARKLRSRSRDEMSEDTDLPRRSRSRPSHRRARGSRRRSSVSSRSPSPERSRSRRGTGRGEMAGQPASGLRKARRRGRSRDSDSDSGTFASSATATSADASSAAPPRARSSRNRPGSAVRRSAGANNLGNMALGMGQPPMDPLAFAVAQAQAQAAWYAVMQAQQQASVPNHGRSSSSKRNGRASAQAPNVSLPPMFGAPYMGGAPQF